MERPSGTQKDCVWVCVRATLLTAFGLRLVLFLENVKALLSTNVECRKMFNYVVRDTWYHCVLKT